MISSLEIESVYETAANLPVSVDEAKLYAKIDYTDEDTAIEGMLAAATRTVEAHTKRALYTQTITMRVDGFKTHPLSFWFPSYGLWLAKPPITSVTSVTFYDVDDSSEVVSSSDYIVDSNEARVMLNFGSKWPSNQRQVNAVAVEYEAGYGAVADIPAPIKLAIKMVFNSFFYGCGSDPITPAVRAVLAPYVITRMGGQYFGAFPVGG